MLKNKILTFEQFITLLGAFMVLYVTWFRFIRERLPKEIPLDLNIFSLLILFIICFTYIYIIFRLYLPAEPNLLIFKFYKILKMIFEPFYAFDRYLKNTRLFQYIYNPLVENLGIFTKYYLKISKIYKIYCIFNFIPRFILVLIFLIDIFYFQRLYWMYWASVLIIFILLFKYFIYSLRQTVENLIEFLDDYLVEIIEPKSMENIQYPIPIIYMDWYEPEPDPIYVDDDQTYNDNFDYSVYDGKLSINKFLEYQCIAVSFEEYTPYNYKGELKFKGLNRRLEKLNVTLEDYDNMSIEECTSIIENLMKDFNIIIPILISLYTFLNRYESCLKVFETKIKKINTIIFSMFLFCWSSILFVSFNIELLYPIFMSFFDKIEPFSGLIL